MEKILILYGTKHGQTEKICNFVKNILKEKKFDVDCINIKNENFELKENYKSIVIASSMSAGGFQKEVRNFVSKNLEKINSTKTYFLSVCLAINSKNIEEQEDAKRISSEFCKSLNWNVSDIKLVAGALSYTKYNFLLKMIMKRIAFKEGFIEKDLTKDYEFTNWEDLKNYVQAIG